jgi:signal transduction histidine kinase
VEPHAQDRLETGWLVEQEAALRRVATLVATGASSIEVFETVALEVAQVLRLANAAICRYDDDGTSMTVLAVCGVHPYTFEAGSRWQLDGPSMSLEVLRTGRATRVEDYTDLPGSLAAEAREHGFNKVAGAPIIVDGRVWGVISTSSPDAPLPDDLEDRLAEFTELLATAIANGQAHEELARLAAEQAALRRVATLVAEGAPPADVFAAVTAEVAHLVGADGSALTRYESDGTVTALGGWTTEGGYVYVDRRYALEGTVSGVIFETGRPGRVDNYEEAPGSAPEAAREMGWRSSVGAPITVEGGLWGVLAVVSKSEQPLPRDTEGRLAKFTDLVATAVANTESRDELSRLADEQAALRRVATLVAKGSEPNAVFAAIADEVAATFGVPIAVMGRYDGDGMATVLATVGAGFSPVGGRFPVETPITEAVFRTGKSVRIDNWADITDPAAARARENGLRWAVGVPIVVDGALWGVIAVAAPETVSSASQVEPRLAKFTELLATAVANSEAHERLTQLAEEHAALRRVATLVAQGATPYRVFDAVRHEVARMFNVPLTVLMRYDADGMATVLATSDGYLGPTGRRWPVQGDSSALARVRQSGRAERVDYSAPAHGSIADAARATGVRSAVGVPVEVDGALWGVMAAGSRDPEPLPPEIEQRLAKFTELLATAIANAESRAELETSRARIVATADATRRRIERDLHDGAQQQLLSLALEVRAAQAAVPAELDEHRAELSHVAEGLTDVLDGLREIALGIHPAILAEGGLGPALKTLANRSPIPVDIDLRIEGRLPESVEVAAYYVASEALTNAAKHARASIVQVTVDIRDRVLRVVVRDDGVGGADAARGSGLLGLKDRAEAIGGRIVVESSPLDGTSLRAELPLEGRA